MRNILAALERLPELMLNLRINVGRGNQHSVGELLEEFPETLRARIQVDVSPISRRGTECGFVGRETTGQRAAVLQWVSEAIRLGFKVASSQLPCLRLNYCSANLPGNVQIAPDGSLWACSPWHKPEAMIGHIDQFGQPLLAPSFDRWHADGELPERCTACRYLCFCGGGCRVAQLRGKLDPDCQSRFEHLDKMILNLYLRHQAMSGVDTL
jgi:radical SAM protein with 4Fe4S-binding SPASM domain